MCHHPTYLSFVCLIQIWQHVKNANPSLSVCEVGASIGRLWREMSDVDKQQYTDDFSREKVNFTVLGECISFYHFSSHSSFRLLLLHLIWCKLPVFSDLFRFRLGWPSLNRNRSGKKLVTKSHLKVNFWGINQKRIYCGSIILTGEMPYL